MILPNFLIIGAARSGTTSLYRYMREHPDIYLPESKRPEPHFFLKPDEYAKGLIYYSERYFCQWNGESAIGEASTSYLYQSCVPERIYAHIPNIKLIAILRNPIDRAYSNYWVTVQNGLEELSFEKAIHSEKKRLKAPKSAFWRAVQPHAYIDRGYYYRQLCRYLKYFKQNQLLILLFDDLQNSPAQIVKKVFRFLGVDESFTPKSLGRVENKLSVSPPPMKPETRAYLVSRFATENEKLSALIGRDMSSWNK